MTTYESLAIDNASQLLFGSAPHPLHTRQGLVIGGGRVYPELNFTLPTMAIDPETMPDIRRQYEQIIDGSLMRAVELEVPGVVIEFETLPPMCETPAWGLELTKILLDGMEKANAAFGLKTVLRITPNDLREIRRPPLMRQGPLLESTLRMFEGTAAAGAELLSIESVGGKELHDDALLRCDLGGVLFALTILGVRDMRFLWTQIARLAQRHGATAAGDTACGFGNTAMVLAERKYIPRVFAAVVRSISAVRSLVAYECGALGPGKDCGYENPFLKAITGYPMAMEGKSAACAHLSPLGNIAAATCDTWSNESVQNIKLLADMAPTCSLEQLSYDCRLMNTAAAEGASEARRLRDWFSRSDAGKDPQAFILRPESVVEIARAIVRAPDHYHAGKAAAAATIRVLREGRGSGELHLPERETAWLDMMEAALAETPSSEEEFIAQRLGMNEAALFIPSEYGL